MSKILSGAESKVPGDALSVAAMSGSAVPEDGLSTEERQRRLLEEYDKIGRAHV